MQMLGGFGALPASATDGEAMQFDDSSFDFRPYRSLSESRNSHPPATASKSSAQPYALPLQRPLRRAFEEKSSSRPGTHASVLSASGTARGLGLGAGVMVGRPATSADPDSGDRLPTSSALVALVGAVGSRSASRYALAGSGGGWGPNDREGDAPVRVPTDTHTLTLQAGSRRSVGPLSGADAPPPVSPLRHTPPNSSPPPATAFSRRSFSGTASKPSSPLLLAPVAAEPTTTHAPRLPPPSQPAAVGATGDFPAASGHHLRSVSGAARLGPPHDVSLLPQPIAPSSAHVHSRAHTPSLLHGAQPMSPGPAPSPSLVHLHNHGHGARSPPGTAASTAGAARATLQFAPHPRKPSPLLDPLAPSHSYTSTR